MLIAIRLKKELPEKLAALQEATGKTRSSLVNQAIAEYVERESWQVAAIKKGIEQADKGKFATDKQIDTINEKWGYDEN